MKKKLVITLVLGVVVLGGGGFWAYQHFQEKPQQTSLMTTTVKKGDIIQEITATGTVMYPEEVPLAFEQNGKVREIYVKVGDAVTAGQALAQMDTETLQQEVTESMASLKEAELSWQQQKVEAEGALVKARQALRTAEQNADPAYLQNQLAIAEQSLLIAGNNLAASQLSGDESSILQAKTALTQAQSDLINVQNTYNGGAEQAVDSAKADLEIAEVKLARLQERTSLAQAETAVVKAQENLAKATLVAPSDGVIIEIPVKEGQALSDTTTVLNLATGGELLIVESYVSQDEVTKIKTGQKANISLDSAPEDYMSATVTQVALKGTTTQNVTTFQVTMQMDEVTDAIRPGMNANVGIIIAEAKDVLIVPSSAVQTQGDQKGVLLLSNPPSSGSPSPEGQMQGRPSQREQVPGEQAEAQKEQAQGEGAQAGAAEPRNSERSAPQGTAQFVPVETGLDDGTNVEIKSGLTEGQRIVAGTRTSSSGSNTNANSNRNMNSPAGVMPGMGGGGGFGGSARPMR